MKECNKCGCLIDFKQSRNGNWYAINSDGKPHFLTCQQPKLSTEEKLNRKRAIAYHKQLDRDFEARIS